jgi:hypothetical protein
VLAANGSGICEEAAFENRLLNKCTNVDNSTNDQLLPSAVLLRIPC